MSRVKAKQQATTTEPSTQRPNVLIFITDQERPTDLWMPKEWAQDNLPTRKFLEQNGLSFTNAFANTNMCSSSRASFFTGLYPAQHGVDKLLTITINPFIRDETQLSPDLFTIGDLLSDDYDVVYKGKWHASKGLLRTMGTEDPSDDQEVYVDMNQYGFTEWEGPDAGSVPYRYGGPVAHPGQPNPEDYPEGYDQGFTDQAVRYINGRSASGSDKPFALVVSLVNPHDLLIYPSLYSTQEMRDVLGIDENADLSTLNIPTTDGTNIDLDAFPIPDEALLWSETFGYDLKDLLGPSGFLPGMDENLLPYTPDGKVPKNYNLKPHLQIENLQGINSYFPPTDSPNKQLAYINFYLNLIQRADEQQYQVIQALEANGFLDNTVIVKTSDHGEMGLAHGGTRQKANVAYQEAVDVPLLWYGPDIPKGKKSDALVSHVDFLPTLAGYLGLDSKASDQGLMGVDYSDVLKGKKADAQKYTLFTFDDIYTLGDPANPWVPSFVDANTAFPYKRLTTEEFLANGQAGFYPQPNRIVMIQNKDFKLTRYYNATDPDNSKLYQEEFYDRRKNGGDYYKPNKQQTTDVYSGVDPITGERVLLSSDFLTSGDPLKVFDSLQLTKEKGYNSKFDPAPLELVNLSPWAEEQRNQPIATPKQQKAYQKMSKMLDKAIDKRLQPAKSRFSIAAPQIVNDNEGIPISHLIPSIDGGNTNDLEIAFTTRANQTYRLQYLNNSGNWVTFDEGIKGTNGPVYRYEKGLPSYITDFQSQIRISWTGTDFIGGEDLATIGMGGNALQRDNANDLLIQSGADAYALDSTFPDLM